MNQEHGLQALEGVVDRSIASAAVHRRPDLNPAANPALAETFAETLPQDIRDSLAIALLENPRLITRIPGDIRAKLDDGEAGMYSIARINDLSEVDVFRMNRAVALPKEVQSFLEEVEKNHPNLAYEASVNLWGQTKDRQWHLLVLQTDQEVARNVAGKLGQLGLVGTYIQPPYTAPPYALSLDDRAGGDTGQA